LAQTIALGLNIGIDATLETLNLKQELFAVVLPQDVVDQISSNHVLAILGWNNNK
jgi:hypothetical protein